MTNLNIYLENKHTISYYSSQVDQGRVVWRGAFVYTIIKHTTKKTITKHLIVAREHISLLHDELQA
jgi:hypothetical protein